MKKENKFIGFLKRFTPYEIIWFLSIVVLSFVVAFLFPGTVDDLDINPILIMGLYLLDIFLNCLCELLISKQSRWNFIVSLGVEITEIAVCVVIAERFATMAVTLFFWIPIDIISFINWNKNKDKNDDDLTVVRELTGWQRVGIFVLIAVWTVGIGYLLTLIDIEGLLEAGSTVDKLCCYLDAACSAVGMLNGLLILFRFKEQWFAWYIVCALEIAMNIMMGQWVLLVLKAGYLTNTTYGLIKWSKYIKNNKKIVAKEKSVV